MSDVRCSPSITIFPILRLTGARINLTGTALAVGSLDGKSTNETADGSLPVLPIMAIRNIMKIGTRLLLRKLRSGWNIKGWGFEFYMYSHCIAIRRCIALNNKQIASLSDILPRPPLFRLLPSCRKV